MSATTIAVYGLGMAWPFSALILECLPARAKAWTAAHPRLTGAILIASVISCVLIGADTCTDGRHDHA